MGPLPHKMNPEKKTGARRAIAYKPTPQENGEVNLRITSPGCCARVSTRAPGLRPHGVLEGPGHSNYASAALTFPEPFHRRLREFALACSHDGAAGGRSGGQRPHFTPVLAHRVSPQTPRHPGPRYTQVYLKCCRSNLPVCPAIV